MERILRYLVADARDAVTSSGRITISTRVAARGDRREVMLSIADTRAAVPEEVAAQMFEPTVGAKRVCAETTSFQHAETRATEELEICVPEVGVMPWAAIYQNVNMSLHDGSDGNLKRGY